MFNLLIILILSSLTYVIDAQESTWRKELKTAQEYQIVNNFLDAGNAYANAFRLNTDKLDFAEKAAVCYLKCRHYDAVNSLLQPVLEQSSSNDKILYYSAIALQYKGQYKQAKALFNLFLRKYRGEDMDLMLLKVKRCLLHCNYSLQASNIANSNATVKHLSAVINSSKAEFAPQAFADNILYFSSTRSGNARVYRTVRQDTQWSSPQIPPVYLGILDYPDFGNGSFSEDGQRYYFTQCKSANDGSNCSIYLMELKGTSWSNPQLLPSYINVSGTNTTHPHVSTQLGYELLYFASNRPGGKGGIDIWYSTRKIGTSLGSFTLPKNVGPQINTAGDELSPFYHLKSGYLYFSSNGWLGLGGLDIFKSEGFKVDWEVVQNLGAPINSSTDDLYFVLNEAHGGAYLVSNRTTSTKSSTIDDDIFYVSLSKKVLNLSGKIMNTDSLAMPNTLLRLYASENGRLVLLDSLFSQDGIYEFSSLDADSTYVLECIHPDYKIYRFNFVVTAQSATYFQDVILTPMKEMAPIKPLSKMELYYLLVPQRYNDEQQYYELPIDAVDPVSLEKYSGDTLSVYYELDALAGLADRRRLYYDSNGVLQPIKAKAVAITELSHIERSKISITSLYAEDDSLTKLVYYKIQVAAVRNFKADKYTPLSDVGLVVLEKVPSGLQRVLLVDHLAGLHHTAGFERKSKALNILAYVLKNTRFKQAFVIKYKDGKRVGAGFRSWDESAGLETGALPDGRKIIDYEGF